jgi:menaquinone-dependent protoporphyrinogen oxidase
MNVLIAYRTRYGATRRCARLMQERIRGEVTLADLREDSRPPLERFQVVLIGGSIYAGRIQREIGAFCERHREELLGRRVGLFLCCLYEGERAQAQLAESFPPWIGAHAFSRRVLGGELVLERLKPLDRLLIRAMGKPAGDVHRLREAEIEALCREVNALG